MYTSDEENISIEDLQKQLEKITQEKEEVQSKLDETSKAKEEVESKLEEANKEVSKLKEEIKNCSDNEKLQELKNKLE
ncbi:hypothetical protein [Spiroplasma endosymbiont of Apeira syringaria]|uniref:hypothetical protein n=1 Tax=Spiroplasma endosymbiont of Apeira syringaria TaxID=3066307 RepID=UPI0030D3CF55